MIVLDRPENEKYVSDFRSGYFSWLLWAFHLNTRACDSSYICVPVHEALGSKA
jgi:hypothetical protein